jgi:hypothetical protein
MPMMKKRKMNLLIKFLVISVLAFSNFACQSNPTILNSGRQTPDNSSNANAAERPKDTFESALRGVQKSGFDYIFVIRRKDGGVFDRDDKVFVRENSPAETNQFVLTDEDRVIIAGSNYPFPAETLEVLRTIFNVEDLSPKKEENANGNLNKEANADSNKTNGKSNN